MSDISASSLGAFASKRTLDTNNDADALALSAKGEKSSANDAPASTKHREGITTVCHSFELAAKLFKGNDTPQSLLLQPIDTLRLSRLILHQAQVPIHLHCNHAYLQERVNRSLQSLGQ